MKILFLSYKASEKSSNTDHRSLAITGRQQLLLVSLYADSPSRPNISSDYRWHDPDNYDNKGKKHFYHPLCKLDFAFEPCLDSLFLHYKLQVSVDFSALKMPEIVCLEV
jgi:hypothetical protein